MLIIDTQELGRAKGERLIQEMEQLDKQIKAAVQIARKAMEDGDDEKMHLYANKVKELEREFLDKTSEVVKISIALRS